MTKKITLNSLSTVSPFKSFGVLAFLLLSATTIGQTVTDVFPSRITTNAKVTLVGAGFTPGTAVSIDGISIASGSVTLISANEMSFKISAAGTSDVTGALTVGGVATGLNISYVSPTPKILKNGPTSTVTKITEIFTTYQGFWRSSQWKANPSDLTQWPNTSHDLLAFTYSGITYSTGVDDALLTANGVTFDSQLFYAYTTNGVDGITQPNNYLAMGDLIDGEVGEGTEITSSEILGTSIYDAIIDGVNGLDLGTGVTNFNQTSDVQFYSAGGQLGAVDDDMPDFLITQIASAGSTDVYFYADAIGNVVGRPIKLTINEESDAAGDALLAKWRLDLYRFDNGVSYGLAKPAVRSFTSNEIRPLRMLAFRMDELGINAGNVADINNINMVAGGTADLAFLAYNRGSFDIKTPVFSKFPVSRFVCKIPSTSDIGFTATAIVSGGATGDPQEALSYQWYKYNTPIAGATNSTYTLTNNIELDDLATYKVKISNAFGAVVAPATLIQGGTPTFWNGTAFVLPPAYIAAGVSVNDEDRGLILSADYNAAGDIEGCNCTVPAGSNAIIPSGSTLKVYNNVVVESGASLTLKNDASIVQTKAVTSNVNVGSIFVERAAADLHTNDLILWSSPVDGFNLDGITAPNAASAFAYDVDATNTDGTAGAYVPVTGTMASGKGYSVRVPDAFVASGFTAKFQGKPKNGLISINVLKSTAANQPSEENNHWNLIGNPYPSSINVDEFLVANTALEGNIRLWSHGIPSSNGTPNPFYTNVVYDYGDQYVTYNRTGSTPDVFNGNIASGQGFIVQVNETSATTTPVSFNNSMRFDDAELGYDNSNFFRSNGAIALDDANKELVWLSLVDASNTSSIALIGYVDGATNGKDRLYDAFSDGGAMRLYSTVVDSKMAIQGRALPFSDTDVVPLGMDVPATGVYSIGIDHLKGALFLAGNQGIYLEDTMLDVVQDLRVQPYSFTANVGSVVGRFILRYTPAPLSVNENEVQNTFVFVKDNYLNVKSSSKIESISVFDLTGKQVITYIPGSTDSRFVAPFDFSKGMYITVIKLENNAVVTKKLMN